ncbi:MAG: MFS transporter [Clostridiales bacterium]|nr:MFS transporter [Clostridiales bacterium]
MCGIMVSMMLPQLMNTWGRAPGGWTKIAMVIGIPMLVIGMGRFIFIKETVAIEKADDESRKMSLVESMKALSHNKYIFILAGSLLLSNVMSTISSAISTYYFEWIVGDLGLLTVASAVGLVAPFVLLLFPIAMKSIGAMNFIRIGLVVAAIGNGIKIFAGASLPIIIIGSLLASVGSSFLGLMVNVFLIECMEYNEWKTGKRVDGYITAFNNFTGKLGSGIASGGVGLLMAATGYVGTAASQPDSAMGAIVAMFSWIPAVFCILMLVILGFYDLDKRMPQIKADNEKNRAL